MENLLEYLSRKAGCSYISDLKSEVHKKKAISILLQMDKDKFPLEQWQDAISYLFMCHKKIDSETDVKNLLRTFLK